MNNCVKNNYDTNYGQKEEKNRQTSASQFLLQYYFSTLQFTSDDTACFASQGIRISCFENKV